MTCLTRCDGRKPDAIQHAYSHPGSSESVISVRRSALICVHGRRRAAASVESCGLQDQAWPTAYHSSKSECAINSVLILAIDYAKTRPTLGAFSAC